MQPEESLGDPVRMSGFGVSSWFNPSMSDPLFPVLPTEADAGRPWLVSYAHGERVELTGRVLSLWHSKVSGFLTQEVGPGARVHLGLAPHWRTVTWCCGTWLAGGSVVLAPTAAGRTAADARTTPQAPGAPDVSVAFEPTGLDPEAGTQVLLPRQSLARRWPGELPPLVVDGVADLMTCPDRFPAPACSPGAPALEMIGAPAGSAMTREQLVRGLPDRARAARAAGARAVAVEDPGTAEAVRAVLAAWRQGLTAVLLDEGLDTEQRSSALRQEGTFGS